MFTFFMSKPLFTSTCKKLLNLPYSVEKANTFTRKMSIVMRKLVLGVSNHVRLKQTCDAIEASYKASNFGY